MKPFATSLSYTADRTYVCCGCQDRITCGQRMVRTSLAYAHLRCATRDKAYSS